MTQTAPASGGLSREDGRHLLRRVAFAATPAAEAAVAGATPAEALDRLMREARRARVPEPPAFARQPWTNTALRLPGMTDAQYDARRAAQVEAHRRDLDTTRQWWLREMAEGPAPLRESLTLFFEGTFGSSTELADAPHAIHQRNALVRARCLGTVPALLEALVLDPAMMMQIGMDEHFRFRVSDRPAKLILDHWTVGEGSYTDADIENLSRALTGWRLAAAPGHEPPVPPDAGAVRAARRTGLTPVFVPEEHDARAKTILGTTGDFDARSAIRLLARHPATARRYGGLLLRHLGVEAVDEDLLSRMAETYVATDGSIEALLRVAVEAAAFWSAESRWALIKSPVHLIVGACRQLEVPLPTFTATGPWLTAAGQTLFDTPNTGEGGWPGQEAWVTPSSRLTVRYQLPVVLSGRAPTLGVRAVATGSAPAFRLPLGGLTQASSTTLVDRLDPAPGLDAVAIANAAQGAAEVVRRVMMSPEYQLA